MPGEDGGSCACISVLPVHSYKERFGPVLDAGRRIQCSRELCLMHKINGGGWRGDRTAETAAAVRSPYAKQRRKTYRQKGGGDVETNPCRVAATQHPTSLPRDSMTAMPALAGDWSAV